MNDETLEQDAATTLLKNGSKLTRPLLVAGGLAALSAGVYVLSKGRGRAQFVKESAEKADHHIRPSQGE